MRGRPRQGRASGRDRNDQDSWMKFYTVESFMADDATGSDDIMQIRAGDSFSGCNVVASGGDNPNLDISQDVRDFFLGVASFEKHMEAQENNLKRYTSAIALLLINGVELSSNSRVRALAAAWSKGNHELADCLMTMRDAFGLPEVIKALAILDAGRMVRVWERKLKQAEVGAAVSGGRVKKHTISRAKNNIDNLHVLRSPKGTGGALSGALSRRLRRWVRKFSESELEFFALHYPTEPWRRLADILHLHPEKDFPTLPWFLRYCYTGEIPQESYVYKAKQINADNVNEILSEVPVPYSIVRNFGESLSVQSKAAIARAGDRVDRAIWWYEELACPEVDKVILERLDSGEEVLLNYGKLMERLLKFSLLPENMRPPFLPRLIPYAESKLRATQLSMDSPIAILADASYSMSIAIRTATIISSLLSAFTSAKIVFFNDKYWFPESVPHTTEDVLSLALNTDAERCTAHAAGLWPFYQSKEVVRTFIVVTDEEENCAFKDFRFLKLFECYRNEVYKARLVFISFLGSQTEEGEMVKELRNAGHRPLQFRMDRNRPDLTKLDSILGQLAAGCADFESQLVTMENAIETKGMKAVFEDVANKRERTEGNDISLK